METAALKSFAVWARTELIGEVSARISVVLSSPQERQENPNAVSALEKAISAAGGRGPVAETVAYTWFNRIIALRYMDANGYTGAGVVSPSQMGGQPEILADANRGSIDTDVVSSATAAEVTNLLNGTRNSTDAFGEAYMLLLGEYCRYWNRSMPFMFQPQDGYTELLMPKNLLAGDSVMARSVDVLTPEVCRDVEVIGWLYQFYISERKDEVFAGFKKNKKAGAAEIPAATQLFTPHWIVRYLVENSLGRLWLLNRPSSALADRMEYYIAPVDEETDFLKVSSPEELKIIDPACGSGHMLTYAFDLLYAIYEEEGYSPSDIPTLILSKNLYGTEIDPRAGALAAFALTMKARHRQRTFLGKKVDPNICVLTPVGFKPAELDLLVTAGGDRHAEEMFWNQFEHADTLGSLIRPNEALIDPLRQHLTALQANANDLFLGALLDRANRVLDQAEYLTSRYNIGVANPPYMGSKNMGGELSRLGADSYPTSKSDLMTMFMERFTTLVVSRGIWGMINLPSWMFLSSFEKCRERLLKEVYIASLVHLGRGVFGADFGSVAFILINSAPKSRRGVYRRLFEKHVDVRRNEDIERLFLQSDYRRYTLSQAVFQAVPGSPLAYWFSATALEQFDKSRPLSEIAEPRQGLATGENERFLRQWFEVGHSAIGFGVTSRDESVGSGKKWFPCQKGGAFRKWYGNTSHVINWEEDGAALIDFKPRSVIRNPSYYFKPGATWSSATSGALSMRYAAPGSISESKGAMCYSDDPNVVRWVLGLGNSKLAALYLSALSPTIDFHEGPMGRLPMKHMPPKAVLRDVDEAIKIATHDWATREESFEFERNELIQLNKPNLREAYAECCTIQQDSVEKLRTLEQDIQEFFITDYEMTAELDSRVDTAEVSLWANPEFRYGGRLTSKSVAGRHRSDIFKDLISYAIGCMFGRYSLDKPGLVLANQGETLQDYLAKTLSPSFMPDKDNVIPIVDGEWFEDDIVARFRHFLRVAFGNEHFEENLRFVTESLGVKDLAEYFVKSFYKDHVQRYKKRPIYWLFSSPKGSFNALVYMHRYTPSTASTVLNEYLREFKAKLETSREHHDRMATSAGTAREKSAALKEVDRLRKILFELDEYEHDILYPVASQEIQIDLDDGVKANYPKLGAALKKIPGLEANDG